MNIIKSNIDQTNKKEVYKLTRSQSVQIQEMEPGVSLPVEKWAIYEEENSKGELVTVLSFTSGPNKYSSISKTFVKSFMECVDLMDGEPFSIIVAGGESKGGRKFVDCELDCD